MEKKKITIDISADDIIQFEQLVHYGYDPFTWTIDGVDIMFIKAEEEEHPSSPWPPLGRPLSIC